jgi:hypothetical protein
VAPWQRLGRLAGNEKKTPVDVEGVTHRAMFRFFAGIPRLAWILKKIAKRARCFCGVKIHCPRIKMGRMKR